MELEQIKNVIKAGVNCDKWYCGNMEGKYEKAIGVYDSTNPGKPIMAIGGPENQTYDKTEFMVLVHYTREPKEARKKAYEVYCYLFGKEFEIEGIRGFFELLRKPVPVGADENSIYEYVIDATVYYEKKEGENNGISSV